MNLYHKCLMAIGCLTLFQNCVTESCEVWYDQYIKPESIACRVYKKYISKNHAERTLVISPTDEDSIIGCPNDVYELISKGDSLYKPRGSYRFKIIHGDTTLYTYTDCHDGWLNEYRSGAFNFCVHGKYKNAYKEGILYYSKNHVYQEKEIGDMSTLFNEVVPGDSISKLKGRVDIIVFKKDTTFSVYPDWYQ